MSGRDGWNDDATVVNKLCPKCLEKCKQSPFVYVTGCKYFRSAKADDKTKP
jgi:hypothetical protein